MKRIFTLALLFSFGLTFGQSLQCTQGSDVTVWEDSDGGEIVIELAIENISSVSGNYHVERTITQDLNGVTNLFCWTACYLPTTNTSTSPLTIAAGEENHAFSFHMFPAGNNGTFSADYRFYNELDPTDAIIVTITSHTTPTGVEVSSEVKNTIHQIVPNPASGFTSINYSALDGFETAELQVFNMLGAMVKNEKLFEINGNVIISTSDLSSGVYFVNLLIDDKRVSTQKLTVVRK
jgi:hypothetical protein